jgi:hypothetical protein
MQQTSAVDMPAQLRRKGILLIAVIGLAAGCAAPPQSPERGNALLLVSLLDGSIVGQQIDADADICMKANDSPATTCLSRGTPLMDTSGQTIVGYEMVQTEISLLPR